MSKTFKHVKTTGFLENAGRIRKARKEARELKTQLLDEFFNDDLSTDFTAFAQS